MPKKGSDESQAALSLGAAGLTTGAATAGAQILAKQLAKPTAQKIVPEATIHRLVEKMGFPEHLPFATQPAGGGPPTFKGTVGEFRSGPHRVAKGWAEIPGLAPGTEGIPLGSAAHEFGHAKGKVQRATQVMSDLLFAPSKAVKVPGTKRVIATPAMSPLHIPLLFAAVTPKSDDKVIKWVQEHPGEIAAGMAAVPLLQEADASVKALRAIKKLPISAGGGKPGMMREARLMAKGFGSHALSHLPAIAGLFVASKVRDLIQKRREAKIEKQASFNSVIAGGESMDVSEVFISAFSDTLNKIASEGEEEYSEEEKQKMKEAKEKKEGKKNGEKKEDGEEQVKEGSYLSNFRANLGLSKTASEVSGLREKLGLFTGYDSGGGSEEDGLREFDSHFDAWKSTL